MDPIEEWHIKVFRPGSPKPDIAQTTLTTWRTARRYIDAAQRIYPDVTVEVIVPESAPESVLTELTAMGVQIFMRDGD
jgi:hypothetical protein